MCSSLVEDILTLNLRSPTSVPFIVFCKNWQSQMYLYSLLLLDNYYYYYSQFLCTKTSLITLRISIRFSNFFSSCKFLLFHESQFFTQSMLTHFLQYFHKIMVNYSQTTIDTNSVSLLIINNHPPSTDSFVKFRVVLSMAR